MKVARWIDDLPRAPAPYDRWQVGLRPLSLVIEEGPDGPWNPCLLLIVESGTGAVLGHRLLEADGDPDLVIDLMLATLGEPATGEPRRPSTLQTDVDRLVPPLRELGAQIDARVERVPDVPELSYVIQSFEEFITSKPHLYLETEGADGAGIRDFFRTAAAFYRAAPWKRISDIEPITLLSESGAESRHAVVMGNGGIVRGLALYDDAEDLEELYEGDNVDPSELACTAVVFVERDDLSDEHWAEIRENGWEVISDKAIPMATRTDAFGPPRTPTMEEIRRLEIALAVVPEFVRRLPLHVERRIGSEPVPCTLKKGRQKVRIWIGYGIFVVDEDDGQS